MKVVLVYQAGIANVFQVDHIGTSHEWMHPPDRGERTIRRRNAVRWFQGSFHDAAMFTLGMQAAGCEVATMGCNMPGDVRDFLWTTELHNLPFYDSMVVINSKKGESER